MGASSGDELTEGFTAPWKGRAMGGLLRKLFGNSSGNEAGSPPGDTRAPLAARSQAGSQAVGQVGVGEDESDDALYEEFCRSFYIRPGVNFMEHLKKKGVTRMIAWLHPSTPYAIPKGFIRLAVDLTRKGSKTWEHKEIRMNYEGSWDRGGVPEQESLDALSVLAQILAVPIKLYYTETQDGPLMVMEFSAR